MAAERAPKIKKIFNSISTLRRGADERSHYISTPGGNSEMARINVEDDVESRPEYRKLLKLVGYDDDKALGMLVRFWRLAQKYWGEGKLVPLEEIETWEFQPLIESRWAIARENGVYARGAEDRFEWYKQRCDAGRSRAQGGLRNEKGQFSKGEKEDLNEANEESSKPSETPPVTSEIPPESSARFISYQPLSPVPVPSPVPIKKLNTKKLKAADAPQREVSRFISTYVKAYQTRYPGKAGMPPPRPDLSGKVQGQIKRYLDEVPIDRACSLIQVFCQMNDRWFVTKHHDFGSFLENQNKVSYALDTGQDPGDQGSAIDWSKVDLSEGASYG